MLQERAIPFVYRETSADPLSRAEIEAVLTAMGLGVRDVLRRRDAARYGFTGDESDDVLLDAMAAHPRMLQRPIGLLGGRAVLGRPPENLLQLVEG